MEFVKDMIELVELYLILFFVVITGIDIFMELISCRADKKGSKRYGRVYTSKKSTKIPK